MEEIELTKALIGIPSVSTDARNLERAIQFCQEYLDDSIVVRRYDQNQKPCLVATHEKTDSPRVFFLGHLDVVDSKDPSLFHPNEENGYLYGTGSLDMKGMVAVFLNLMNHYAESKSDLGLILSSDEEVGGRDGVQHLVNMGYRCDVAIAGEPTQHAITCREKGILWVELGFEGVSGHSSTPYKGNNAWRELSRRLLTLEERFDRVSEERFWQTSFSPDYFLAGDEETYNRIPPYARAKVDIRYTEPEDRDEILGAIEASGIKILSKDLDTGRPVVSDPNHPLIRKLGNAVSQEIGEVNYIDATFFSDARFFGVTGVPAVCFGPKGEGIHSRNERLNIQSLSTARKILYRFIDSLESSK